MSAHVHLAPNQKICMSASVLPAEGLIQELSSRGHDIGSSAMSVPAGIFGTISANANAAPRLLLGDVIAVYHTALDAYADLNARGRFMQSFYYTICSFLCPQHLKHIQC